VPALTASLAIALAWTLGLSIVRRIHPPQIRLIARPRQFELDADPRAARIVDLSPLRRQLALISATVTRLERENSALRGPGPHWTIAIDDSGQAIAVPAHRVGPALLDVLGLREPHACAGRPRCERCLTAARIDIVSRAALTGTPPNPDDLRHLADAGARIQAPAGSAR